MDNFITVDSGERQHFDTGAKRDTRSGKGRYDLASPVVIHRDMGVFERGCEKYGERNWEKGMPFSRFLDSATRHLNEFALIQQFKREGIPLDRLPEGINPNEDHLAQARWNIGCIMHFETFRPELNDLIIHPKDVDNSNSNPEISAA